MKREQHVKSLLRSETVRYEDASITLQTPTLYSGLLKTELVERLSKLVTREANYIERYSALVTQAIKAQGLGFELPDPDAADDVMIKAFNAYMRLPVTFIGDLMAALSRLSEAPGTKPELQPKAEVTAETAPLDETSAAG